MIEREAQPYIYKERDNSSRAPRASKGCCVRKAERSPNVKSRTNSRFMATSRMFHGNENVYQVQLNGYNLDLSGISTIQQNLGNQSQFMDENVQKYFSLSRAPRNRHARPESALDETDQYNCVNKLISGYSQMQTVEQGKIKEMENSYQAKLVRFEKALSKKQSELQLVDEEIEREMLHQELCLASDKQRLYLINQHFANTDKIQAGFSKMQCLISMIPIAVHAPNSNFHSTSSNHSHTTPTGSNGVITEKLKEFKDALVQILEEKRQKLLDFYVQSAKKQETAEYIRMAQEDIRSRQMQKCDIVMEYEELERIQEQLSQQYKLHYDTIQQILHYEEQLAAGRAEMDNLQQVLQSHQSVHARLEQEACAINGTIQGVKRQLDSARGEKSKFRSSQDADAFAVQNFDLIGVSYFLEVVQVFQDMNKEVAPTLPPSQQQTINSQDDHMISDIIVQELECIMKNDMSMQQQLSKVKEKLAQGQAKY